MERATEVRFYRPKDLSNPYPRRWDDIREFSYDSDLHLLRLSGGLPGIPRSAQYIVEEPYTVSFRLDSEEDRRSITVPKGMLTDLASVPRCFRWYAGRVGPHLEAAIVHDFLYVAWHDLKDMCPNARMRFFAGRIMLAAMKAAGTPLVHSSKSFYGGVPPLVWSPWRLLTALPISTPFDGTSTPGGYCVRGRQGAVPGGRAGRNLKVIVDGGQGL